MNVLYLANINNIHDFKWVSYFASKEGIDVFLITEVENFKKTDITTLQKYKDIGVEVLPPIDNFSICNFPKSIKSILLLRKLIRKHNIDVFHTLFGSPQPIWLVFLPKSVRLGITTRGSDVFVLLKEVWETKNIINRILKWLLKRGYRKAEFITCTSTAQIETIKDLIPNKLPQIHFIKTGVDVEAIQKTDVSGKVLTVSKEFVFSARFIEKIYNIDYQLEAIKELDKEFLKKYSFLFVAFQYPVDVDLTEFKSELDKIEGLQYDICSQITQAQMWATIKASALVYMVPTTDGTPNTALECMAAEKRFIMGNLDYNKELFEDVSLIADLSNPQSLTQKLTEGVVTYPEYLIKNGLDKVTKFGSREFEMKKLLKLYTK
ncbi:glycosyltransferase [Flavobacteriales bacterium]|nr:glycosyltransferase [Flavobacteriales bacterium]